VEAGCGLAGPSFLPAAFTHRIERRWAPRAGYRTYGAYVSVFAPHGAWWYRGEGVASRGGASVFAFSGTGTGVRANALHAPSVTPYGVCAVGEPALEADEGVCAVP